MAASILTVVTPAVTHDLTTLETVKDELNVTDTASDARYTRWIAEASGFIRFYCNRTFAAEGLSEQFRFVVESWIRDPARACLTLRRRPVSVIASITEDGTALAATDYEADLDRGSIWRLSSDVRVPWSAAKVVVAYTAGYALLDGLPYGLETACLEIVKHRLFARERDPMVRQQSIPGELEQQWWVPGANEDGVPPTIRAMLDPHRDIPV